MDKSICCIHGCGKPHFGKFLCNMHYTRLRTYGTTRLLPKLPKVCRMPGCEKPSRKLRWCSTHHSRLKRTGSPFDHAQKWVWADFAICLICGDPTTGAYGLRRYCSSVCATSAHLGERSRAKACGKCGAEIDLMERHPSGRRKYSSASYCQGCSRTVNLSRFVPLLVERDGNNCGLCGESIDLTLSYPELLSRSVDHVIPRSLGGADSMDNFQLAHLLCNIKKQNHVIA